MAHFGCYDYHSEKLVCPKCGQTGAMKWEDIPHAVSREMLDLEGDFYERLARKSPYPIELVCKRCGTTQPEQPLQP